MKSQPQQSKPCSLPGYKSQSYDVGKLACVFEKIWVCRFAGQEPTQKHPGATGRPKRELNPYRKASQEEPSFIKAKKVFLTV